MKCCVYGGAGEMGLLVCSPFIRHHCIIPLPTITTYQPQAKVAIARAYHLRLRDRSKAPPLVYFKLQPSRQFISPRTEKHIQGGGGMNNVNNEQALSPVGENRQLTSLPIISCIFFLFFFLDVQKCNMLLSTAETQHERSPGIISMAENNLILSESVEILFAWLWRASLCRSVSWQAGRRACKRLSLEP